MTAVLHDSGPSARPDGGETDVTALGPGGRDDRLKVPYPAFDGTQHCASSTADFYTADRRRARILARMVCRGCPFQADCLLWGLHYEGDGVWGATTPAFRDRLREVAKVRLEIPPFARHIGGAA